VPLYIKLPYQRERRHVSEWVSLMDIYPTVVEAMGIEASIEVDGRSLMPLMKGTELRPKKMVHVTHYKGRCVASALTTEQYKLVDIRHNYEGLRNRIQLFDRKADPKEQRDIAEQHPEVVSQLSAELARALKAYKPRKVLTRNVAKGAVP